MKKIFSDADIPIFHSTVAYNRIVSFIIALNNKAVATPSAPVIDSDTDEVVSLLNRINAIIEATDLDTKSLSRFGNIAFRSVISRIEEELTISNTVAREHFITSFGSKQRLDYGTGHELSFLAFLKIFAPEEDKIITIYIPQYIKIIQKLILKYKLEPAGSHGVWGLDDHFFLPYLFGSAALIKSKYTPKDITNPPKSSDNLFFQCLEFINTVKKGPFFEHSPTLYNISGLPSWAKINSGLLKMYNGEVLSKFPVVQHFSFDDENFSYVKESVNPSPQLKKPVYVDISTFYTNRTRAVSAPAKVLLAGGYLVLDPLFEGLVIGLDARIYTVISTPATGTPQGTIQITSVQFAESAWTYSVEKGSDLISVKQSSSGFENPYLQTTLHYILNYLRLVPPAMDIRIYADNQYYSQPPGGKKSRFNKLPVAINKANKTGLGSSAALILSFAAALLTYLEGVNLSDSRTLIHNLAQISHCAAQGKVGSGFDVAAATYGSCVYRRFRPELLSGLGSVEFDTKVKSLADSSWEMEAMPIQLPKGLQIIMADVEAGSQTSGMVKNILAWRSSGQEAEQLWQELGEANKSLIEQCISLAGLSRKDNSVSFLRELQLSRWKLETLEGELASGFKALADAFKSSRKLLRKMGELAGVGIEPPSQTKLVDACLEVEGVYAAGVPGAGGLDAIYIVIYETSDALSNLKSLFKTFTTKVGVLDVVQSEDGMRIESVESVIR